MHIETQLAQIEVRALKNKMFAYFEKQRIYQLEQVELEFKKSHLYLDQVQTRGREGRLQVQIFYMKISVTDFRGEGGSEE